ncbi:MAG: hypothetical protein QGH51_01935 [Planctomycetota bacterium]|jgi:predicted  nucleic acid-binding Zn-ribbon protein|nr:hypothetical protein [Planctomycetota bacterium]MDP6940761.1 hypothetical protein [Planctomycetota bacterium]
MKNHSAAFLLLLCFSCSSNSAEDRQERYRSDLEDVTAEFEELENEFLKIKEEYDRLKSEKEKLENLIQR